MSFIIKIADLIQSEIDKFEIAEIFPNTPIVSRYDIMNFYLFKDNPWFCIQEHENLINQNGEDCWSNITNFTSMQKYVKIVRLLFKQIG